MEYRPRDERGEYPPARSWQRRPAGVAAGRGAHPDARPAYRDHSSGPDRQAERRSLSDGREKHDRPNRPARSSRAPKITIALVSLLVFAITGFGWWSNFHGLNYSNVLQSSDQGEKPADGARDILLVGLDSRTDAQGNPLSKELLAQLKAGVSDGELNTDSLILVHIPNDGGKAIAISLPRDSYVDVVTPKDSTTVGAGGYGKHKINSAYARAKIEKSKELQKAGETDSQKIELESNQEGAKTLIATVEKLVGFTIDNYAAINLLGFSEITQAIGGVDVCLKENVKDTYSGADFKAGPQTISGASALAFVRQRHGLPNGDLDRVVRQQVFMAGLANKVLSGGVLTNPGKLTSLIDAMKKSVVLNQGWDLFGFAEQMKGLTGGALEFRTIPVVNMDYHTPEDGAAIQVDPKQIKAFIQGTTTPTSTAPPPPPNSATTVDVHNASGKTGLASDVSQQLVAKGFTAGRVGNANIRKSSVVLAPEAAQASAQVVAEQLGGKITVETDSTVSPGHVTVLLGTDYTASASSSTGSSTAPSSSRSTSSNQSAASTSDNAPTPPITANGVTCVN